MMSYFSSPMYSNKHGTNLPYNSWYPGVNHYHPSPNAQFMESDMPPHHQAMYYNAQIFHSPDWPHEFPASGLPLPGGGSSAAVAHNQLSSSAHSHNTDHLQDGLPSPPVTVSGSEMSSPGAPNGSASPQIAHRPNPNKSSPPFEWLNKTPQPHTGMYHTQYSHFLFIIMFMLLLL